MDRKELLMKLLKDDWYIVRVFYNFHLKNHKHKKISCFFSFYRLNPIMISHDITPQMMNKYNDVVFSTYEELTEFLDNYEK